MKKPLQPKGSQRFSIDWRSGRDTPGLHQNLLIFIRKFFGDVTSVPEKTVPLVVTPVIVAGSLVLAYSFPRLLDRLGCRRSPDLTT